MVSNTRNFNMQHIAFNHRVEEQDIDTCTKTMRCSSRETEETMLWETCYNIGMRRMWLKGFLRATFLVATKVGIYMWQLGNTTMSIVMGVGHYRWVGQQLHLRVGTLMRVYRRPCQRSIFEAFLACVCFSNGFNSVGLYGPSWHVILWCFFLLGF